MKNGRYLLLLVPKLGGLRGSSDSEIEGGQADVVRVFSEDELAQFE